MSVNGFLVNNEVQKYNYESLENYNTPDFNTSSTYKVGDYVMYQGKLYKCTTAITTSGAWDSTKWSLAILSDDVADLNSQMSNQMDGIAQILIDTFYSVTWNMPNGNKYIDAINSAMGTNIEPSFHGAISINNVLSSVGYTGLTYNGTRFQWESMASGNCIIALNQNVRRVYGTSPKANLRFDLAFKKFDDGSFLGFWGDSIYKFIPKNGAYSVTKVNDVVIDNSFQVPHNGEEVTVILENGNMYVFCESQNNPMIIHDANIIGFVGHAGYSGYPHQLQSMEAF